MKIHHFEKRARPKPPERDEERLAHERPTLLEFEVPVDSPPPPPAKAERAAAPPGTAPRPERKARASAEPPPAPRKSAPAEPPPAPGSVAERIANARRLAADGALEEARAVLERLVSLGVATAPVYTHLGSLALTQGATQRALEYFEEALARDPLDLLARLSRGAVRLERGELRLAQEDLLSVLEEGTAGSPLVPRARELLQLVEEARDRKRR